MDSNNGLEEKTKEKSTLSRFLASIEEASIDKKIQKLIKDMDSADKEEKLLLQEVNSELIAEFVKMHEFDKHLLLADSLPLSFGAMSIKMTKSIIEENHCNTDLEISLVEIIVNAFCRSLHFSRLLSLALSTNPDRIEQKFINYYAFLSKEIDKATRQYLSALLALQQLKTPPLKVNLKAHTAILGQNQQFNSIKSEYDENNKPN